MRVLVTGGTGLIGRHLLERLTPAHEVIAITRRDPPPLREGVEWIRQDLAEDFVVPVLPDSIDAVVHLAQSERYRDLPDGAEDVFEVNVHSTFRLLEHARRAGASNFVLASTGGVYESSGEPIREDAPLVCPGAYFRSKRMAELLVENYADVLRGVILRLFFVYGPGEGKTLIPRLAGSLLSEEEIQIEGDPGMRMNPIHAQDAAAVIESALTLERSAVVNVAGDEVVSITELVQRLGAALGRSPRLRHVAGGEEGGDMIAEISRMRELLGVRPETGLNAGLRSVASPLAAPTR